MEARLVYDAGYYAFLFQKGDEKGFAWFFRTYYANLSLYCFKITGDKESSEEIASHAFIKTWQRHERFQDADSIKAYLYRVVRNDALKYLQREKRLASLNREVVYLYGNEHEKDCFNSLVSAEIARELSAAIDALPAQCSKVFRLLYLEGKSIKETAEVLQLSVSTVKTQKKRGLDSLRKIMPFLLVLFTDLLVLVSLQVLQ